MNLNLSWMESEWTQALGWTFVHSIWQIALIGLALVVVLRFVPRRHAHARYTISTLALWLIVCVTLSTFLIMLPNGTGMLYATKGILMVGGNETMTITESVAAWIENRMPMMLTIWAGGVSILMIRLLFSLGWIRHVRSTSIPEKEIQLTLNSIISRLKLKISPIAASTAFVSSPMTIGHLKPFVLFPIGMLNQISPKEVEAILIHELAHIVRKDYLSNLLQSFIETLFYYHPITWWISSMVRAERENRADDLAVAWCGDQLSYVKALMAVQEMQVAQGPSLAIGFASGKGAMLARIKRILNVPHKNYNQMEKTVLLSLTTLCFLAFTLTSHTRKDKPSKEDFLMESTITLTAVNTDSIPSKGTYRIHKKTDDQEISVEVEDGAIKELKVNGNEVAPAEYDGYDVTVNELFGNMQAPRVIQNFDFDMPPPPPPPIPEGLYDFEYEFEMPSMPDMPAMDLMYFLDGNQVFTEGTNVGNIKVITKKIDGGEGEIMIMINGDTMTHEIKSGSYFKMDDDLLNGYNIEWKENVEQWKENAKQWKDLEKQYKDELRFFNKKLQSNQDIFRYEIRSQNEDIKDEQRELLEMYELKSTSPSTFGWSSHRLNLSEEMVNDGLVKPGTEIEVQLTPAKLKINGEKMPDAIHQKYLKLYESQQGVELSGKSKVEFTTKSKVRM